jgi:hypothetical protein
VVVRVAFCVSVLPAKKHKNTKKSCILGDESNCIKEYGLVVNYSGVYISWIICGFVRVVSALS